MKHFVRKGFAIVFGVLMTVCLALFAAACREANYRIVFMNEGGEYSVLTLSADEPVTFPADPEKAADGSYTYEFCGWSHTDKGILEEGEAAGELLHAGDELFATGETTLYAVYRRTPIETRSTYTVIFYDGLTGTRIGEEQHVLEGEDAVPPTPPVHEGYTFKSWDRSYTNIAGRTEVRAQYEANNYSLVLHYMGAAHTLTVKFGASLDGIEPEIDSETVLFEGWYYDEACTAEQRVESGATMPAHELHLYAGFTFEEGKLHLTLTGDRIYGGTGDDSDIVNIVGLSETAGVTYSFAWTGAEPIGNGRTALLKRAGSALEVSCTVTTAFAGGSHEETVTGTFSLGKATLTAQVSLAEASLVYGTQPAVTVTLGGWMYDDTADGIETTVTYLSGETPADVLHAGTYTVTAALAEELANYELGAVQTATLTITPKDLTVTATAADITYGEVPAPALTFEGFAYEDGESSLTATGERYLYEKDGAAHTGKFVAGQYTVQAGEFTSADYTVKKGAAAAFTVAKRALTLTVTAEKASLVYGEMPAWTVTKTAGDYAEGDDATAVQTSVSYGAEGLPAVGEYTLTLTASAENYDVTAVNGSFAVTHKPITVTVVMGKQSYVYGEDVTAALQWGAFVGEETAADLFEELPAVTYEKGEAAYTPAHTYFEVGSYTATVAAVGEHGNYVVAVTPATFAVAPKALTATVSAEPTYVYGETVAATATWSGYADGEGAADVFGTQKEPAVTYKRDGESYDASAHTYFEVGSYTATVEAAGEQGNYVVSVTPAQFTVTPKALTATVSANSAYTYGDTVAATATWNGYAKGESAVNVFGTEEEPAVTYKRGGEAYTPAHTYFEVGSYTATVETAPAQGNYTVTVTSASFEVKAQRFTVATTVTQWRDASFTFTPAFGEDSPFKFEGTVCMLGKQEDGTYEANDQATFDASFKWQSGPAIKLAADDADVTANFELAYDLSVTFNSAQFSVTAPEVKSYVYDGTEHAFPIAVQAMIKDITPTIEYSVDGKDSFSEEVPAFTDVCEHTIYYQVTAQHSDTSNGSYTVSITKAQVRVAWTAAKWEETFDPDTTYAESNFCTVSVVTDAAGTLKQRAYTWSVAYSGEGSSATIHDAGTYTLTVALKDGSNFDFEADTQTQKTFTINRAAYAYNVMAEQSYTYNGSEHGTGVELTTKVSGAQVTYSIGDAYTPTVPTFTNAGKATVNFKITGNSNYTDVEDFYTVSITKATNKIEVDGSNSGFTYDKTAHAYSFTATADFGEVTASCDNGISVSAEDGFTFSLTNAGTYTVIFKVDGTDNYAGAEEKVIITVAQAEVNIAWTVESKVYAPAKTYTESELCTVSVGEKTLSRDAYTWSVKYGESAAQTIQNAGTYTLTVALIDENYTLAAGAQAENTFEITKAAYAYNITAEQRYTYNGGKQGTGVELTTEASGAQVTYSTGGDYTPTVPTFTNAGKATVNFKISGNSNYTDVNGSYTVTIDKAPAQVEKLPSVGEQVNYYGKTLGDISLGDHWQWENTEEELQVGSHAYNAIYNPDTNNYEDCVTTITFTTTKTQLLLTFSQAFKTEGLEVDYTGWQAQTAEQFAGSYTLVGKNRSDVDIKGREKEFEYLQKLWNGGPFSLETPFADGKIYGGTYLLLYRFSLTAEKETENPYYEWAAEQNPTALDDAFLLKIKSVDVGGTLYTIEDALKNAQSGATITVKYNTAFATKAAAQIAEYTSDEYYTVKNGVTLLLPYNESGAWDESTGGSATQTTVAFGDTSKRKVELVLASEICLINNGIINVGGQTTGGNGGGYGGQTYGDYAQITLDKNAKIESVGTITCYGFIVEKSENNGSQVHIKEGTATVPFFLIEHRGGSAFYGAYKEMDKKESSPFNRFFFHNITSEVRIESKAELLGHANLFTSGLFGDQQNTTDVKLIGSASSGSLIALEETSYVVAKLQAKAFTGENAIVSTQLDIYGDMTLNSLSLKLTVLFTSVSLSTGKVLFPISWLYHVNLHAGEANSAIVDATAQSLKILPGGSLTVGKGVTLKTKTLAVYADDDWNDVNVGTGASGVYPNGKGDGILTVNGRLEVETLVGVLQDSAEEGATVAVTSAVQKTVHELNGTSGKLTGATCTWCDIPLTLKLKTEGGTVTEGAVGTYTWSGSVWQKGA